MHACARLWRSCCGRSPLIRRTPSRPVGRGPLAGPAIGAAGRQLHRWTAGRPDHHLVRSDRAHRKVHRRVRWQLHLSVHRTRQCRRNDASRRRSLTEKGARDPGLFQGRSDHGGDRAVPEARRSTSSAKSGRLAPTRCRATCGWSRRWRWRARRCRPRVARRWSCTLRTTRCSSSRAASRHQRSAQRRPGSRCPC